MIADKMATLKDGQRKSGAQICASQAEAADMLGVSRRSVQHARKVLESGNPELIREVESGEAAVSRAAAKVPKLNMAPGHVAPYERGAAFEQVLKLRGVVLKPGPNPGKKIVQPLH